MESSLLENIHNNVQFFCSEGVKPGYKADEIPDNSKYAKARRRVTFTFPISHSRRRGKNNRYGIPPVERRAAEQVNLLLPKVGSLTGAISFQRPTPTDETSRRRHSYTTQASRDYSLCILDLPVCDDDDSEPEDERVNNTMKEPQIHPLRMHPVEKKGPRSTLAGTDNIVNVASIPEILELARGPKIAPVAETVSATTTNDNTDSAEEKRSREVTLPHNQKVTTEDPGSGTSSVYSADWFPFHELSQISWRTTASTPADESLLTTPKAPYRMGKSRRYGWAEGQPF